MFVKSNEGDRILVVLGDNPAMLIRASFANNSRRAISGGKRPNPSDLGS